MGQVRHLGAASHPAGPGPRQAPAPPPRALLRGVRCRPAAAARPPRPPWPSRSPGSARCVGFEALPPGSEGPGDPPRGVGSRPRRGRRSDARGRTRSRRAPVGIDSDQASRFPFRDLPCAARSSSRRRASFSAMRISRPRATGGGIAPCGQAFGQVGLPRRVALGLVVRVAVAPAVAELAHEARSERCAGAGAREASRAGGCLPLPRRTLCTPHRSSRRRRGRLRPGRSRSSPSGLPRRSYASRSRVRIPDVLGRHPDETAHDVQGIASSVQHAANPVEGRVRTRAPDRLVDGGDEVVEGVAALVETAKGSPGERLGEELAAEAALPGLHREAGRELESVEGPAHVAVRRFDEPVSIRRVHHESVPAETALERPPAPAPPRARWPAPRPEPVRRRARAR